jgi:2-polyprenyl-6-hydroxyphenyl methylase/3-demethylubiquinone-9 3-methyltransferase
MAIIGAEYILNWLPKGTHNWNKFIKPSEITSICNKLNLKLIDKVGFTYSILQRSWFQGNMLDINYITIFRK